MSDAGSRAPDPLALIGRIGVVPVVTVDDVDAAVPLVEALVGGGLAAVEITLRTPAALGALERAATVAGATVGAGTVLSHDQARAAIDAGARFVVSPGFDEGVVTAARERAVVAVPGVATPTELMRALAMDVTTVKLFPAEVIGGAGLVRALSAVFPGVWFIPTGGISASTAPRYLESPSVLAVGGSWMVDPDAVVDRRWDDIRAAAAAASALVGRRP